MSQVIGKRIDAGAVERLGGAEIESHEGKIIPIFTTR